jgi:hypothetical protein
MHMDASRPDVVDRPDVWPPPMTAGSYPSPTPRRDMSTGVPVPAPGPAPVRDGPPASGWTLMVAGQRTGKTSFLRLLLDTSDVAPSATPDQAASVAKFVQGSSGHTAHIRQASIDVLVADGDGQPRRPVTLTVVDTPSLDFADEAALERQTLDVLHFVDAKFAESYDDVSRPDARSHSRLGRADHNVAVLQDYKARSGNHHVHL